MPSVRLTRLAALIAVFFALYTALLFVGRRFGVSLAIERAITAGAVVGMRVLSPAPVERVLTLRQQGSKLQWKARLSIGDQSEDATFTHPFHAQNFFLFLALVLATPGLALRQRAWGLGIGWSLIYLLDVLIVMGDLWIGENTGMKLDTRLGANRWLSEVSLVLRFLHPTGGVFMAPVFGWAIVIAGPFRGPVMARLSRRPAPEGPPLEE